MKSFFGKALTVCARTLQILHLLRVQIFVAILATFLIPVGVWSHNGTFIGLADAIQPFSLGAITASLFLLAWTLHITSRLVLIYGPDRYAIPDLTTPPANPTQWQRFFYSPWFTLTIAAAVPVFNLIVIWQNTSLSLL